MAIAAPLLGVVVILAGCTAADAPAAGPRAHPGAMAPIAPATGDALADFAARAAPGTESMVPGSGGTPERAKLLRHYTAASGRECREVLTGSGAHERTALFCRDGGSWTRGRPLLRTGSPRS